MLIVYLDSARLSNLMTSQNRKTPTIRRYVLMKLQERLASESQFLRI